MQSLDHFWAVILAAGRGKRLESFRVAEGESPVPKQFRSFIGCESMLRWTIRRAEALVPKKRILCVVTEEHRCWWQTQLEDLLADNVVVQPGDKGTAVGILLPLFTVLERDPLASVLVLPSDHFVDNEEQLGRALRHACGLAQTAGQRVVLIGVEAGRDIADYGWIVPGDSIASPILKSVSAFSEKPDLSNARRLQQRGALVNSLILAATGRALLHLFSDAVPELVGQFSRQWHHGVGKLSNSRRVYDGLSSYDFSHDVLERQPESLLVYPAPSTCGWVDLGTPARMNEFLGRHHATAA